MKLIVISEEDLRNLIRQELASQPPAAPLQPANQPETPTIKGIHNLAKFLNISPSRAQSLKNQGLIPFFQSGRTVLFDPQRVRQALSGIKTGRK